MALKSVFWGILISAFVIGLSYSIAHLTSLPFIWILGLTCLVGAVGGVFGLRKDLKRN